MNKGIVVGTWHGGRNYATRCLNSLEPIYGQVPIYVVVNDWEKADPDWLEELKQRYAVLGVAYDGYELGAIFAANQITNLDEFWFFQDTIEITDCGFILETLNQEGFSYSYGIKYMLFYLGKYRREVLSQMFTPKVNSKEDAMVWEWYFNHLYYYMDGGDGTTALVVDGEIDVWNNENYTENLYGEDRLVIKGKYLLKRMSLTAANIANIKNPKGVDNV
jgi:hypothetical protein